MTLFYVTYTMIPGKRDAFLQAVRSAGILDAIRKEPGCLHYAYYLPEEEDNTLLLVERWTDAQAQKVHIAGPNMARLAELKPQYITETRAVSLDTED